MIKDDSKYWGRMQKLEMLVGGEGSSGSTGVAIRKWLGETKRNKHQQQRQQLAGRRSWRTCVFHWVFNRDTEFAIFLILGILLSVIRFAVCKCLMMVRTVVGVWTNGVCYIYLIDSVQMLNNINADFQMW